VVGGGEFVKRERETSSRSRDFFIKKVRRDEREQKQNRQTETERRKGKKTKTNTYEIDQNHLTHAHNNDNKYTTRHKITTRSSKLFIYARASRRSSRSVVCGNRRENERESSGRKK